MAPSSGTPWPRWCCGATRSGSAFLFRKAVWLEKMTTLKCGEKCSHIWYFNNYILFWIPFWIEDQITYKICLRHRYDSRMTNYWFSGCSHGRSFIPSESNDLPICQTTFQDRWSKTLLLFLMVVTCCHFFFLQVGLIFYIHPLNDQLVRLTSKVQPFRTLVTTVWPMPRWRAMPSATMGRRRWVWQRTVGGADRDLPGWLCCTILHRHRDEQVTQFSFWDKTWIGQTIDRPFKNMDLLKTTHRIPSKNKNRCQKQGKREPFKWPCACWMRTEHAEWPAMAGQLWALFWSRTHGPSAMWSAIAPALALAMASRCMASWAPLRRWVGENRRGKSWKNGLAYVGPDVLGFEKLIWKNMGPKLFHLHP